MAALRTCPVLRAGAVTGLGDVDDRLTEIRDASARIAPRCGIAQFSDLYLAITRTIQGHIRAGGFFADDGYLSRLDVVFANRYFDALRAWAGGGAPPECWRLLFELPADGEITGLQLAAGGVNAHINLDLAVAVVDTGRELGDAALGVGRRHDDYTKVNDVFAEQMDTLLRHLLQQRTGQGEATEAVSLVGRLMTGIIAIARRHAWDDAVALWSLPRRSDGWRARERRMDAVACWLGRRLLVDLPG